MLLTPVSILPFKVPLLWDGSTRLEASPHASQPQTSHPSCDGPLQRQLLQVLPVVQHSGIAGVLCFNCVQLVLLLLKTGATTRACRIRVRPGPDVFSQFQKQLHHITGMPLLDAMQITFQCKAPDTGNPSSSYLHAFWHTSAGQMYRPEQCNIA